MKPKKTALYIHKMKKESLKKLMKDHLTATTIYLNKTSNERKLLTNVPFEIPLVAIMSIFLEMFATWSCIVTKDNSCVRFLLKFIQYILSYRSEFQILWKIASKMRLWKWKLWKLSVMSHSIKSNNPKGISNWKMISTLRKKRRCINFISQSTFQSSPFISGHLITTYTPQIITYDSIKLFKDDITKLFTHKIHLSFYSNEVNNRMIKH